MEIFSLVIFDIINANESSPPQAPSDLTTMPQPIPTNNPPTMVAIIKLLDQFGSKYGKF